MSNAIKNAIEAMEFAQHAVGPFHRVATKKLRESIAELKAIPQAQASKPIAAVTGWYDGRCVIEPLDRALAIPVGMALYTAPPAAAVNQQLLEALEATLQTVEDYTILIHEEWGDCRTLEKIEADGELHKSVLIARAAIAAAQEQK